MELAHTAVARAVGRIKSGKCSSVAVCVTAAPISVANAALGSVVGLDMCSRVCDISGISFGVKGVRVNPREIKERKKNNFIILLETKQKKAPI